MSVHWHINVNKDSSDWEFVMDFCPFKVISHQPIMLTQHEKLANLRTAVNSLTTCKQITEISKECLVLIVSMWSVYVRLPSCVVRRVSVNIWFVNTLQASFFVPIIMNLDLIVYLNRFPTEFAYGACRIKNMPLGQILEQPSGSQIYNWIFL